MRKAFAIPAIAFLTSIIASAQTTGSASASGACSLANSGNNNSSVVINCGIGAAQGKKILNILNTMLAHQIDPSAVMKKLDEILAAEKQARTSGGSVTGSDNTVLNDPRSIHGDGNTIVGGDANGNVIIPGGTAIGRGAHADSSTVAIGAGAGAGNTESSGRADCPNNAGNCAGVNNGTQIVQGYVPPPFRVVTQSDVGSAVDALKAQSGNVSFTYIGSTADPEISAFFNQIRGIFVAGGWNVVGMSIIGEMNINVNGAISHGEGFHCTVDSSVAGDAAKKAMEAAGYECNTGMIQDSTQPGMTRPTTPNAVVSIGTRIIPPR